MDLIAEEKVSSSSIGRRVSLRKAASLVKSEKQAISQTTSRLQSIKQPSVINYSMHGVKPTIKIQDSRSPHGSTSRIKDKTEVLAREIGRRRETQDQGSRTKRGATDVSKIWLRAMFHNEIEVVLKERTKLSKQ